MRLYVALFMKRSTNSAKEREIHKLKERLSVRERQFAAAVKALKKIVEFRSAHCSVFQTEVHHLQRDAILALCELEEIQRGKAGRDLEHRKQVLMGKILANEAYGRWGSVNQAGQLFGSEDDL